MLLGAYMWRGRSYDVSHKAGALLEVDSDVDVVASSGMCVGVCVCVRACWDCRCCLGQGLADDSPE